MVDETWTTRELPILRTALEQVEAGQSKIDLGPLKEELGLDRTSTLVALHALYNAGYIGGHVSASGAIMITDVTERTRRELGAWPSATSIVDELVVALQNASEREPEPERRSRLKAAEGGCRDSRRYRTRRRRRRDVEACPLIGATHLGFFETMAGVIPVIFLALIVEERVEPDVRSFWDYLLPVVSAGFLIVGEALALLAVYRGHGSSGLAGGVSTAAAVGAFLLLGDAAVGRADKITDEALKRKIAVWTAVVLFAVLLTVVAIGFSAR